MGAEDELPEFEVDLAGFGLDGPDSDTWVSLVRSAEAPRSLGHLGPFELLELVGRGGQGVVFRARHRESGRIHALKRLHEGRFADEHALRRLRREVEAASTLDHPGIVRVADHVELFDEQPVVVMEWVRGTPVTEWVAAHHPLRPLDEVLQLFRSIAGAVEHAHGRGVVHRDLKPSNILVDAEGMPRLMDFGLAKLMDEEASALTLDGQFVGTLAYAAPEQLRGAANVDERADVYALGAVLFELLTGRVPLLVEGTPADHLHTVLNDEPDRPSSLRPLSRDVDAVLLKALARKPEARYGSVTEFASDVDQLIAGRAVRARPPSRFFSAQRFVRRNRWPVALVVSVVLFSLGFGAWAHRQNDRLVEERDRATEATNRATAEAERAALGEERATSVLDFFVDGLFSSEFTAFSTADALELASTRLQYTDPEDPAVLAAMHLTVGRLALKLGSFELAQKDLGIACEQLIALHGRDHLESRAAQAELGWAALGLEDWQGARKLFAPLRADEDRTNLRALHGMAMAAWRSGDTAAAWIFFEEASFLARQLENEDGPTPPELAMDFAAFLVESGRRVEARAELEALVERSNALFAAQDPAVSQALHGLGLHAYAEGESDEAILCFKRALEIQVRTMGESHPSVGTLQAELGKVYLTADEPELGLQTIRSSLELVERAWGEDHHNVATIRMLLAAALQRNGRLAEAERMCRDFVARRTARFGANDQHVIFGNLRLAEVLLEAEEYDECAALLDGTIPLLREARTDSLDQALFTFSECLDRLELFEDAEAMLGEALDVGLLLRGEREHQIRGLFLWGDYAAERGDHGEAVQRYAAALDMDRRVGALDPTEFGIRLARRAEYVFETGDWDEALEGLREARSWMAEHPPEDPLHRPNCELFLGRCLGAMGRVAEARERLESALELCSLEFPGREDCVAKIQAELAELPHE